MATIVTRAAKGSPLTHVEVDANFTNLNTDKAETADLATVATTGAYADLSGTPASALPLAGGTLTGNVNLDDNVKANFGAGSDLQIFHDGINSYIDDAGNGDMLIRGSARILLRKAGTTENMIHAEADSYVKLFYDNAEKLATTATGIQITGTALATTNTATLTGDTTLDFATNQNFVLTLGASLTLLDPTTEQVGQSGFIVFIQDGTGSRGVSLDPQYKTAGGVTLALSGAAGAIDVVPYIVSASGSILLGAPQLAFA
jgi:hypothetical protein